MLDVTACFQFRRSLFQLFLTGKKLVYGIISASVIVAENANSTDQWHECLFSGIKVRATTFKRLTLLCQENRSL